MPVTAKLSKRFYDALGEQVANELVDWFNSVDATYRADLRELNELNFARFDAKLEQRLSELRAELRGGLAELRADLVGLKGEFNATLPNLKADLLKWMFVYWLSSMVIVLGTIVAVILK